MKDLRNLQFNEALLEATDQAMTADGRVILMGLGVTDPLGIFGTTKGLVDKFGCDRVFETPTAENGTMGIAIGSATAVSALTQGAPDVLQSWSGVVAMP